MMINYVSIAGCLTLLAGPVVEWFGRLVVRRKARGRQIQLFSSVKTPLYSISRWVLVGVSMGWALQVLGCLQLIWVLVMLPLYVLLERKASQPQDHVSSSEIAFFEALEVAIATGADFFAALAAAGPLLGNTCAGQAVSAVLKRFSERQNLENCLPPLSTCGPFFSGLAADVRRAGWEPSPALKLSVRQMLVRVQTAWKQDHRMRLAGRRIEAIRPMFLQVGLGTAAVSLVMSGGPPNHLGQWLVISCLGILVRGLVSIRRPFLLAGNAALVVMGLWLAFPDSSYSINFQLPAPAAFKQISHGPRSDAFRSQEQPVAQSANSEKSAREVPVKCRVTTGFNPGWARLRAAPAMDSATLGYYREGEVLDILRLSGDNASNDWTRVRAADGTAGWMYGALCQEARDAP